MTASPIQRFQELLARASECEPDVPNAAVLATADREGRPSARVVLIRVSRDASGFDFHTNYHSRKGRELDANPYAALCIHWKMLAEQVRIEGRVERLSAEESDAYFARRPQRSQLAALASSQSDTLASRAELERRYAELCERHGDELPPRPEHWGGYRLIPERIEFWKHGEHRLHQRVLYERSADGGWAQRLLYP